MISTFICVIALVLILVGIWHEEKLIAFEGKVWRIIRRRAKRLYLRMRIERVRMKLRIIDCKIYVTKQIMSFINGI